MNEIILATYNNGNGHMSTTYDYWNATSSWSNNYVFEQNVVHVVVIE
jgi:hypothetical protein